MTTTEEVPESKASTRLLSKYALKKAVGKFAAAYPDEAKMRRVLSVYTKTQGDQIVLSATMGGAE